MADAKDFDIATLIALTAQQTMDTIGVPAGLRSFPYTDDAALQDAAPEILKTLDDAGYDVDGLSLSLVTQTLDGQEIKGYGFKKGDEPVNVYPKAGKEAELNALPWTLLFYANGNVASHDYSDTGVDVGRSPQHPIPNFATYYNNATSTQRDVVYTDANGRYNDTADKAPSAQLFDANGKLDHWARYTDGKLTDTSYTVLNRTGHAVADVGRGAGNLIKKPFVAMGRVIGIGRDKGTEPTVSPGAPADQPILFTGPEPITTTEPVATDLPEPSATPARRPEPAPARRPEPVPAGAAGAPVAAPSPAERPVVSIAITDNVFIDHLTVAGNYRNPAEKLTFTLGGKDPNVPDIVIEYDPANPQALKDQLDGLKSQSKLLFIPEGWNRIVDRLALVTHQDLKAQHRLTPATFKPETTLLAPGTIQYGTSSFDSYKPMNVEITRNEHGDYTANFAIKGGAAPADISGGSLNELLHKITSQDEWQILNLGDKQKFLQEVSRLTGDTTILDSYKNILDQDVYAMSQTRHMNWLTAEHDCLFTVFKEDDLYHVNIVAADGTIISNSVYDNVEDLIATETNDENFNSDNTKALITFMGEAAGPEALGRFKVSYVPLDDYDSAANLVLNLDDNSLTGGDTAVVSADTKPDTPEESAPEAGGQDATQVAAVQRNPFAPGA